MALGQSDPHPSASVAGGVRHALRPSRSDSQSLATRARPQNHSPHSSGHILRGRRINRSDLGRPAVPKSALGGERATRAESTPGIPGGPSTQKSLPQPLRTNRRRAIGPHGGGARPGSRAARARPESCGFCAPGPVKGPTPQLDRKSAHARQHPVRLLSTSPASPPDQTPLDCFAPCECSPSM